MTAPKKPAKKPATKKPATTKASKAVTSGAGTVTKKATGTASTPPNQEEITQSAPSAPSSTKTETPESSDSTTRQIPEPEVEAPLAAEDAGVPERFAEDYQAGVEAAKRGWPVRVCPHGGNVGDTDMSKAARHWWLKGYHAYAHPQSNATVVPQDGNTEGGVYRGKY